MGCVAINTFSNGARGYMENQHIKSLHRKVSVTALLLALGGVMPAANAELALNFEPAPAAQVLKVFINCHQNNAPEDCLRMNSGRDPDPTPFRMELINEVATGRYYYHVLIGDKDQPDAPTSFSQEYYVAVAGGAEWFAGYPQNVSAGNFNGGYDATPFSTTWSKPFVNPLADTDISANNIGAGSGSGRPDRVVFNQVIRGPGFSETITKANVDNKPKITQTINEAGISSNFVLDMSTLNYYGAASLVTGAPLTNTLQVTDMQTGEILVNFDNITSSQRPNINAGKYIYNSGSGPGGSNGTYTYETATYAIHETKWINFWDENVNISTDEPIPNF